MVQNYTPIDTKQITEDKNDRLSTILLFLVTFLTLVLAILLFAIIQNKMKGGQ